MIEEAREIDALKQILQTKLPLKDTAQKRFDKKIRLEFTFNSNHMEGNTLTYDETKLLLLKGERTGTHTLREFVEMSAHDIAYNQIKNWASDEDKTLTEMDIKDLNSIILVESFNKKSIDIFTRKSTVKQIIIGDYKKTINGREENGVFKPYASVEDTAIEMGELLSWYRQESEQGNIHPIELAALFHYRFVCIHPFDDGNGRIARLLLNYILLKNNYPPIVIKSSDKSNYIAALRSADDGNMHLFTKYIASLVHWSISMAIKVANGQSIDEPEDLDKKLALLKSHFKQDVDTTIDLRYSIEAIKQATENIIKPLIDHWEMLLKKFDSLFYSRQSLVSMDGKSKNRI